MTVPPNGHRRRKNSRTSSRDNNWFELNPLRGGRGLALDFQTRFVRLQTRPPTTMVCPPTPAIQNTARRKLKYLHRARVLHDLAMPPGNRLEVLKGARKGQHSIRINDQWRICFEWREGNAERVEIVDYH